MRFLFSLFLLALFAGKSSSADFGSDAAIEFENRWVRVVRVHYTPYGQTAVHEHPATPTVYVYVTDGGRLSIAHGDEEPVLRPPVKAGAIRFQKGALERHSVKELDGVDSQYIRIELKTRAVDLPVNDVRRSPADRTPFESGMIRIRRVTCPPHSSCAPSAHPEDPAVVVSGRSVAWVEPYAMPLSNPSDRVIEQVRVELKTRPSE